jgi:hypothetical protein
MLMWRARVEVNHGCMSTQLRSQPTTAFFVQAGISFGVSTSALLVGIAYSHTGSWVRAFMALGLLYAITSAFTLAKCIRDRQEASSVTTRIDQARLDKLLAEHDLFKVEGA